MRRELPRTLFTLLPPYQKGIDENDVDILVVDNGSGNAPCWSHLPPNTRLLQVKEPTQSPVPAINMGLGEAYADLVGVLIDGARMTSPGLLKYALLASVLHERPIIATLGFHLGPDVQMKSVELGYCQEEEDQLLDSVDWRSNGYHLFEISTFAGSSSGGWFKAMAESNALFMPRRLWNELGDYDER